MWPCPYFKERDDIKMLEGKYNPAEFEEKLYTKWEGKGYFKPN